MSVDIDTNRVTLLCNGVLTTFPFSFPLIQTSDLKVYLCEVTSPYTVTTLIETTDYSVVADNNDYSSGGNVETVETYSSNYKLVLLREVPPLRLERGEQRGLARLGVEVRDAAQ